MAEPSLPDEPGSWLPRSMQYLALPPVAQEVLSLDLENLGGLWKFLISHFPRFTITDRQMWDAAWAAIKVDKPLAARRYLQHMFLLIQLRQCHVAIAKHHQENRSHHMYAKEETKVLIKEFPHKAKCMLDDIPCIQWQHIDLLVTLAREVSDETGNGWMRFIQEGEVYLMRRLRGGAQLPREEKHRHTSWRVTTASSQPKGVSPSSLEIIAASWGHIHRLIWQLTHSLT